MLAPDRLSSFVHALDVERQVEPANLSREDRGADRMVVEDVDIGAARRGVAGVKLAIDLAGPLHRDRVREMRVRAAHPGTLGPRSVRVEVNHLASGMHPRI